MKNSTSLIPGGISHTFALLPKPERPGFTPDSVTRGSLRGDQSPLLLPKGRPIIWTQVLTSPMGGTPLLSLILVPHQVSLCIQGTHPDSPRGRVPLDQAVRWHLEGSLLLAVQGCTLATSGVKIPQSPQSQTNPQEMLWETQTGSQDSEARKHRHSGLVSKGWAPWTKGSHLPYIPLQAGYRVNKGKNKKQKPQGLTHIWLHATL
jgi:hypothetical protein